MGFHMKDVAGKAGRADRTDREQSLHPSFGQIGIAAVAAAARYGSDAKNPATLKSDQSDTAMA
jgi:hypothetical protein